LQPDRDNFLIDSHVVVFWLLSKSASLSSFMLRGLKLGYPSCFVFDDLENSVKTCRCKDQLFLNIFFIEHFDPLRASNYSPSPLP